MHHGNGTVHLCHITVLVLREEKTNKLTVSKNESILGSCHLCKGYARLCNSF
jgi:hypothetical protein